VRDYRLYSQPVGFRKKNEMKNRGCRQRLCSTRKLVIRCCVDRESVFVFR